MILMSDSLGSINPVVREEQNQWHMSTLIPLPPISREPTLQSLSNSFNKYVQRLQQKQQLDINWWVGRNTHSYVSLFVDCSRGKWWTIAVASVVHFDLMHNSGRGSTHQRDRIHSLPFYNQVQSDDARELLGFVLSNDKTVAFCKVHVLLR